MIGFTQRHGVTAMASLAAVVLAALPAHGQSFVPIYPGGPTYGQYLNNIRALGQGYSSVPPYLLGNNPYVGPRIVNYGPAGQLGGAGYGGLLNNPYLGGYGGSGYDNSLYNNPNSSYGNPYGGYLEGVASVITAQGKFAVQQQQAVLVREQIKAERLKNRRAAFDEYLYEQKNTPSPQELREQTQAMELRRSLNDPPVNEILSAKALNDLLADLKKQTARGSLSTVRGSREPLDEGVLRHINVTGSNGGNVGLLKNGGRLSFPLALSGDEFKVERERLTTLSQDVVSQAEHGNRIDAATLKQMNDDVNKIQRQIGKSVGDLSPSQYIETKRFLNNLSEALNALARPDASNYFNRNWAAKGKNVPELIKSMLDKGLSFAPAVPGDEAAYVALHRAMASYLMALQPQGGGEPQQR